MATEKLLTIDELLARYRASADSELDKGAMFERLMKNFLLTYPVYDGIIDKVWLWNEFPFRADFGGRDLGIDLVAKTFEGELWAVQCKFYAEDTTIDKPAVDSFISSSARIVRGIKFSKRIFISTSSNFTENAKKMLENQTPPVVQIDMSTLRIAAEKNFGYVIVPIIVPSKVNGEVKQYFEENNEKYQTIYEVARMLGAHDDNYCR